MTENRISKAEEIKLFIVFALAMAVIFIGGTLINNARYEAEMNTLRNAGTIEVTVKSGDTLYGYAEQIGSVGAIVDLSDVARYIAESNGVSAGNLQPGTKLRIPKL